MNKILTLINDFSNFLWSYPLLLLIISTHLYFTLRLKLVPKYLFRGIRLSFSRSDNANKGVSPYSALATALATTIGTGNIISISTAVAIGGPGSVLWCWLTGVFGIGTCYCESFLSHKFRVKNSENEFIGGPMYVYRVGG